MKLKIKNLLIVSISGLFAGIFIGFGGIGALIAQTYIADSGIAKLLSALIFTVGLFFICIFQMNLYTGKIGYIINKDSRNIIHLFLILLFNFLGAYLMGLITYFLLKNNTEYIKIIQNLCNNKINFDSNSYLSLELIIKGILCGGLVFIATYIFKYAKTTLFKYLGIIVPIFIFAYAGFEHCIANVYYFGSGFIFSWYALENILIVIISNSIGSIIFALGFKFLTTTVND